MAKPKKPPVEEPEYEPEVDPELLREAERIIKYAEAHKGGFINFHRVTMSKRGIRRV